MTGVVKRVSDRGFCFVSSDVGETVNADRLECFENLKERQREIKELTAAGAPSTTIAAVLGEQQRLERLSQFL